MSIEEAIAELEIWEAVEIKNQKKRDHNSVAWRISNDRITALRVVTIWLKYHKIQPNEPLTREELLKMDGKPAYCKELGSWGLVSVARTGVWKGVLFFVTVKGGRNKEYWLGGRNFTIYRRPPKEGTKSKKS